LHYLNIEQASRATLVAFKANIPIAWWGAPGIGKSSAIQQLQERLISEDIFDGDQECEIFDLRLSDKEPSDIGGIPFPQEIVEMEDGKKRVRKVLQFLVMELLPFDSQKKAIVLLDEFDRADMSVQNAALQLVLDRKVNGHKLSPNARIVLAGNNATDIGTSPLSAAAANRMCHLYIDINNEEGLKSWMTWADRSEVSPLLQGFAGYQTATFAGGKKDSNKIEELAYPTPRSFVYADKLVLSAMDMPFDCEDIVPALIAGCVGRAAAAQFLGFREIYQKLPTPEQIIAEPETVALPKNPSIFFAHKKQLVLMAREDPTVAEAVAKYALRWPKEAAADLFRMLIEACPKVEKTVAYKKWLVEAEGPDGAVARVVTSEAPMQYKAFCMGCKQKVVMLNPQHGFLKTGKASVRGTCPNCQSPVVTLKTTGDPGDPKASSGAGVNLLTPLAADMLAGAVNAGRGVDDAQYVNRILVPSTSGTNRYTIAQERATGEWRCSCQGHKTHKHCKHVDALKDALVRGTYTVIK
jgi:Domain of unknown function (DUF5679)